MPELDFLPFSSPNITQQDIDSVVNVLRSGWITTGAINRDFEEQIKAYIGCKYVVCLNSETSLMECLLQAYDIEIGDEVITPSMTWVSLPNMVALRGAKPVFVDCNRDTLMISAEEVEKHITARTKLIVPVHFAGVPFDLDGFMELSNRYNIPVIQDAAHAWGSSYKGSRIGSSGTAMFSLHPIKNITAGEGGVLVTDDERLAARVRSLKFHGLGVDAYDRATNQRSAQAVVLEPGYKANLPDMLAALGLSQLKRLDKMNAKRLWLKKLYADKLRGVSEVEMLHAPEYEHTDACHLLIIRVLKGSRDKFIDSLKTSGIGTGIHFRAVHTQPFYRTNYSEYNQILPNTTWNSERICSLPLFVDMNDDDVERVVNAIKNTI